MPDFGLTEALAKALEASKSVRVMRPAEAALAEQAAKTAPGAAAPAVPSIAPKGPVARMPSVETPPSEPAPGDPQAPPVNPSQPPTDLPPAATAEPPAPAGVAPGAGDAAPPTGALAASQDAPVAPLPEAPSKATPPASQLPVEAPVPPAVAPSVQQTAENFLRKNLKDVQGEIDMTHMPNTDVMSSPDRVKSAILQIADKMRGQIQASRRGTIADEQLIGMAQDLAINGDVMKQVMERELGQPLNPETMLAARMIEQYHTGTLLGLSDRVVSGNATSEEIVRFEQQMQLLEQYRTQLSGAQAEWGRGGRALQIPTGLPTATMDHISDVISRNNPDLQATAKAIKLAGTPAGIANIVQGSLWYRSLVKAPFGLLQRIFINGILSGPPTWLKIGVGNNFNLALNQFDLFASAAAAQTRKLAARIGRWPTAEEGATWDDALAHLHGVISGGADALRVAGRVLRTGESMDGILRSEEDNGRNSIVGALPETDNTWFGSVAKGIDTGIGIPGRIIGAVDDFTKTLGYRGYLTMMTLKEIRARVEAGTLRAGDAEQVMLQMMQNPSEEMQQAAETWAHRMTFQSPWPVDPVTGAPLAGARFQAWLNAVPAARFVFPFMRTATNIFKQTAERTPFAFFSARMRNAIMAGGTEGDIARSRLVTGTAIGSMLAWMAINDRITGDAPKDPKARRVWESDGRTPYSIRVTDPITGKEHWDSYTWFEPIATVAGVVADAVQLHSYIADSDDIYTMMPQEDRYHDVVSHIMASVIQNTGNKTFMQGAAQFAEMYNDPARAFDMWKDQMGAAMVPFSGALRFARNEQDPYLRQAFTLMDKIRDELPTIPGVKGSKTLMPRLDLFGEPRKTTSGNSIIGPLDPLPSSDVHKDDVTAELHNIMEQTRTVPITMPSRTLALDGHGAGLQGGTGMRLTDEEYYEYVRNARATPIFDGGTKTFREKLSQMMALPLYQNATPPERATFWTNVQHNADRAGAAKLYRENEDFRERMTAWTADMNRLKFNK